MSRTLPHSNLRLSTSGKTRAVLVTWLVETQIKLLQGMLLMTENTIEVL